MSRLTRWFIQVLGTDGLYEYMNTYGAKLDKPTEAIMGMFE